MKVETCAREHRAEAQHRARMHQVPRTRHAYARSAGPARRRPHHHLPRPASPAPSRTAMTPAEEKRIAAAVVAGLEPRLMRIELMFDRLVGQVADLEGTAEQRWDWLTESMGSLGIRAGEILDGLRSAPEGRIPLPSVLAPAPAPPPPPAATSASPASRQGSASQQSHAPAPTPTPASSSTHTSPPASTPASCPPVAQASKSVARPERTQPVATTGYAAAAPRREIDEARAPASARGRGKSPATPMSRTGVAVGVSAADQPNATTPTRPTAADAGAAAGRGDVPTATLPRYANGSLDLESSNPTGIIGLSGWRQLSQNFQPDLKLLAEGRVTKAPALARVSSVVDQSVWGDIEWFTSLKPTTRKVRIPGQGTVQATAEGQLDVQVRQGTASRPSWTTIRLDKVLLCPKLITDEYTGIISLPPFINGGKASVEIDQKAMLTLPSGKTVGMSVLAPPGVSNKNALQLEKLRARIRAPRYKEGLVRFDNLATYPIFHDKSLFDSIKPCDELVRQSMFATFQAHGKGTVRLQVWTGAKTGWKEFVFREARWCPDYNLRGEGPQIECEGVNSPVSIVGPGQTKALGSVGANHTFNMSVELADASVFLGQNRKYKIGVLNDAGFVFQGRINPLHTGPSAENNLNAKDKNKLHAAASSAASSHSTTRGSGHANYSRRQFPAASSNAATVSQVPRAGPLTPTGAPTSFKGAMTELARAVLWKPEQDGARHMFNDLSLFDPSTVEWQVCPLYINGRPELAALARGTVHVKFNSPEKGPVEFTLKDALYVPDWEQPILLADQRHLLPSPAQTQFAGIISSQALCEPADGPYRYVSFAVDEFPVMLTLSNDPEFDHEISVATLTASGFVADATFLIPPKNDAS